MPSKPDKYGMKVWWACDSKTFYPLNGLPYTGKENCVRVHSGVDRRVVETLSYQRTNRNVTCDNYFTDKELAENLLSNGLTLVGTVQKKYVYSSLLSFSQTKDGQSVHPSSDLQNM
ncbi:hypothetical protein ANN_28101 [Periplaneta americana]|uniref:PiggyBac transposable element-derived protein domain-containing protein n=1 Tax=Periplaneta americana TaxID=6978 RepID=A0ABQ8RUX5_PERAM|nr:hypothetical protein ANN_28101 [Periplaneta americana]